MLILPMIAAALVLRASGFDLPASGSAAAGRPAASEASPGDEDGARALAKRPAQAGGKEMAAPRWPSQGRIPVLPGGAPSVDQDDAAPGMPTRESAYVCPSDMAMIGRSYCIDRYEASLVEVLPNGAERPWPYYATIPQGVVVREVSVAGVYPQGYVSGLQARAACERSGKRLCKPDEWRDACMGPRKTVFPYGNQRVVGRCNDNGRSAMLFFNPKLDGKPEHRWMWGYAGNMIDPRLNQLAGTLTRTGERSGCTNEYGVFDMVGNLHEWVDDPDGTFQGGYYLDTHLNGDGCHYRTTAHPISHFDYSTGFRCCADVEGL